MTDFHVMHQTLWPTSVMDVMICDWDVTMLTRVWPPLIHKQGLTLICFPP